MVRSAEHLPAPGGASPRGSGGRAGAGLGSAGVGSGEGWFGMFGMGSFPCDLAKRPQRGATHFLAEAASSQPAGGYSSPAYLLLDRADLGYSTTGEEITHTLRNAPPEFADGTLAW